MPDPFELANSIQPAVAGFKSCGCCVAVDLDAMPETIDEYRSRGYEIRLMPKKDAVAMLKASFCQHRK
jgi:hypothetical protein